MSYHTFERYYRNDRRDEDVQKIMKEAYEKAMRKISRGIVADYIPELAKADPNAFGICMMDNDGQTFEVGDVDTRFTMQSVSKVITLAASLKYRGHKDTFSHVLMEPSGDQFNSILKLDTRSNLPFNPLINAGAIQVVSLLVDRFSFDELLEFTKGMCMDEDITLNEAVYDSERQTGDRNRAIAYLLKSKDVLMADPEETLDLYFKMCSLNVNARSLAGLGIVLANGGLDPFRGKHFIAPTYVRTIKSIMFTCGMYDRSGEWGVRVGLPAKSGVGGGIVCPAGNDMGFGLYGPALDKAGNSVAGFEAMEYISLQLGLHMFEA